jgi:hypothetical protein
MLKKTRLLENETGFDTSIQIGGIKMQRRTIFPNI